MLCVGGWVVHVCICVINTHSNYFICGVLASSSRCTFHRLAFSACVSVALLTRARHVERIIGLPTSQYTNICFPLHVLNNVSPHLLLAYSQSHRFTSIQYIVLVCISVCLWFFYIVVHGEVTCVYFIWISVHYLKLQSFSYGSSTSLCEVLMMFFCHYASSDFSCTQQSTLCFCSRSKKPWRCSVLLSQCIK